MSRKRENSVFRAIGLTRKQLCQMTIYEGICSAFSAALATLAVGLPIAMSRKRENSVFRAIGLTRKQLCQMTIYEGICSAFSAALATLAVGLPIAVIFARKFSEMTFHVAMPYSFPFLQMGLFVLVIYEGICYAFSAALATLAVGLPIAVIFARKFSEMTFHVAMPYSFPFLHMGLFVLVLFGLEVILSFWTMRRQKNQSLVEEMRAME